MKGSEFFNLALIHVGAALVKCYDEKCDGIIDNEKAREQLANEADMIAAELLEKAWVDYDDDEEEEEEEKEKVHHLVPEEELTDDERRVKRMCEEYDQLEERVRRLEQFIETDTFRSLPLTRGTLARKHLIAMKEYRDILKRRIDVEGEAVWMDVEFKNAE